MGAVFALFAGFYYWAGKIVGINYPIGYNEMLGNIHFWLLFIEMNITFFPMHFLGLAGQPRRIPDYPDAYTGWNDIASYGSMISLVSVVILFFVLYSIFHMPAQYKPLQDNYWGTLEFNSLPFNKKSTPGVGTSKAPFYYKINYNRIIRVQYFNITSLPFF